MALMLCRLRRYAMLSPDMIRDAFRSFRDMIDAATIRYASFFAAIDAI